MGNMRFKVGDRVLIKSLDWYNKNKSKRGNISFPYEAEVFFASKMSSLCGQIVTISQKGYTQDIGFYRIREDKGVHIWTDEMIEGLVKEENNDCEKCGLIRNSTRCLFMDNCPHNKQKNIIEIPEGYIFKDENGNVINATKIVLEKKEKEYPKTYEECRKILKEQADVTYGYKKDVLHSLQKLLICRDAYWKIAGEEMGLDKPWEPDWNSISDKYCIYFVSGYAWSKECQTRQCPFAFPTAEMRDAFKMYFGSDIEICKELL